MKKLYINVPAPSARVKAISTSALLNMALRATEKHPAKARLRKALLESFGTPKFDRILATL